MTEQTGVVELTSEVLAELRKALSARMKHIENNYPKLVEACPYEMRLAIAAWVIEKVVEQARDGGSFRYFIYELLGFNEDAYVPLYTAGGMTITNEFVISEPDEADASIHDKMLETVNAIDKALDEKAPNARRSFLLDVGWRVGALSAALATEQEKRSRVEYELAEAVQKNNTLGL